MKKSTLLMVLSLVLAIALGVGSTLAYLTDTDADKNVMTVGRVSIVQNEQQRVEDENDIFTSELEPFENNKMLLPVTGRTDSADDVTVGEHPLTLSDKLNNYIDKIVSVTNTGNTDAWVRTLIAVPTGGGEWEPEPVAAADCWLHWNLPLGYDDHWELTGNIATIEVDGVNYYVWEFLHNEPVTPGETTFPMMRGLYMDELVDMETVVENGEKVDRYYKEVNGEKRYIYGVPDEDGKVNVLVLSQAVQAEGFDSAEAAMDAAFPIPEDDANTKVQSWFAGWDEDDIGSPGDKWPTNNPPVGVWNWEQLKEAVTKSQSILIMADFDIAGRIDIEDGIEIDMDMNGHTITDPRSGSGVMMAYVKKGGKLTIRGDGTFYKKDHNSNMIYFDGELNIIDGTFKFEEYEFGGAGCAANCTHAQNKDGSWNWLKGGGIIVGSWYDNGVLNIYDGTFDCGILNDDHPQVMYHVLNAAAGSLGYRGVYNVMGGTFVSVNPVDGDCNAPGTLYLVGQTEKGVLPDGYTITENTLADGRTAYTVIYEKGN